MNTELQIRLQVFNWLKKAVEIHGDVLPRKILEHGFEFNGERITLVGAQGIWKPSSFEIPISITTTPNSPYSDSFSKEGMLLYKYQGTDPMQWDNAGLRKAMQNQIPLIYFHGIVPSRYLAVWPVFIVGDDQQNLTFKVAVEEENILANLKDKEKAEDALLVSDQDNARRTYITSLVKGRLHQRAFREKVLKAYRQQCAMCRLKHMELLDAAHIIPDSDPEGDPVISNGLSLCKIHHAAYDKNILGVRPDLKIEVRGDILKETDGPMLQYGLQKLNGTEIVVPFKSDLKPNKLFLERRFEEFRKVG